MMKWKWKAAFANQLPEDCILLPFGKCVGGRHFQGA